jgi:5-methylcytosine-specific restriction protein B
MNSNYPTFSWTGFYQEFANCLLKFKNNRGELLEILRKVYEELAVTKIADPFYDREKRLEDICPFTVFATFNKQIKDENRHAIMQALATQIGVQSEAPTNFEGIPLVSNFRSWFFGYYDIRQADDIHHLWSLFEIALSYADTSNEVPEKNQLREQFITLYDCVRKQFGVQWNLTMGLFWIRPYAYINLDGVNREFLLKHEDVLLAAVVDATMLKQPPDAWTYLTIIQNCNEYLQKNESGIRSLPALSHLAWVTRGGAFKDERKVSGANFISWFPPILNALKIIGGSATPDKVRQQIIKDLQLSDEVVNETRGKHKLRKFDNEVQFARNYLCYEGLIDNSVRGLWKLTERGQAIVMTDELASEIHLKWNEFFKEKQEKGVSGNKHDLKKRSVHYWVYAPGNQAIMWDTFYENKSMSIGWPLLGNLRSYKNKDELKKRMQQLYGDDRSYRNDAHTVWQFVHELQEGDIVYAKKGQKTIVGRGVVGSIYSYNNQQTEYPNVRMVDWTHTGQWDYPGNTAVKTLTDISDYTEVIQKLELIIGGDGQIQLNIPTEETYDKYTAEDFLSEVFVESEEYEDMVEVVRRKKNIVLQGAPGVGKTFIAKRLAFSMMGVKDDSRVSMIQFHQSYSYEDFIMGYRPNATGFELRTGPFYDFCKLAQDDMERDYFFIIDEINRGNLSKIFGELFMLIEADKRGHSLRLIYSNEYFSVPPNVHLIGMMNTADRSLAMIDYALRRRFAFFEIEPGFEKTGFEQVVQTAEHPAFKRLVQQIIELNKAISNDSSLGDGFRIGHSYLCVKDKLDQKWIESVIEYEIIPLLQEYWFDEPKNVAEWSKKLRDSLKSSENHHE